jgi:hypothetical protein
MNKTSRVIAVLLLSFVTLPVGAVTIGQTETFDDADHGWFFGAGPGGVPAQALPRAFGGPAGAADSFLSIVATGGSGPRSRLSALNEDQWTGDYLAAGVNRIAMDVRNFGDTDLFLRLLFVEFGAMGPVSAAFTGDAILVPSGSNWGTIFFDIALPALMPIPEPFLPLASPASTMSNVGELRIFHNPAPFFAPGMNPPVVAALGVDNITALAVPEPATWLLLASGLMAVFGARRVAIVRKNGG